jgi:hypothetical protein
VEIPGDYRVLHLCEVEVFGLPGKKPPCYSGNNRVLELGDSLGEGDQDETLVGGRRRRRRRRRRKTNTRRRRRGGFLKKIGKGINRAAQAAKRAAQAVARRAKAAAQAAARRIRAAAAAARRKKKATAAKINRAYKGDKSKD